MTYTARDCAVVLETRFVNTALPARPRRPAASSPLRPRLAALGGALLAVFSTACATPAERAAYAERQIEVAMNTFGPACDKLGFQRGTDPWRECVLRLHNQDQNERAAYLNAGYYGGFGFGGFYPCYGRRFC